MATFGAENRTIKTPYLRVEGNCLEISETCIQLKNISLFSTSNVTGAKLSILLFAAVFFSIGMSIIEKYIIIGLLISMIGMAIAIYWIVIFVDARRSKRLIIITNSGISYSIIFDDKAFLGQVVNVLTQILRDPEHSRGVVISVNNCRFMDSSSAIGNMYDWKE